MPGPAPLLIAVPSGLIVSGVATWAVRLVNAMAARGRVAGLVLHRASEGHARLEMELHPGARVFDLSRLMRFEDVGADGRGAAGVESAREAWVGAYAAAARSLAREAWGGEGAGPVVVSPNLHADCYGVCVEVARRCPGLVRLVGWQHNDIAYDRGVLAHYGVALAEVVGVSGRIVGLLRGLMGGRSVEHVAYGVEVPGSPVSRPALVEGGGVRAVRLLYSGRLDHHQKRVLALAHLSARLLDRGIAHELTIAGDGPAAGDLDRLIADVGDRRGGRAGGEGLPIRRLGAVSPERVGALLEEHDALVLGSRFEGLSVAMLEAMARGCVPIVTRVESGALEAIEDGVNGLIAEVDASAGEEEVGGALAGCVARFVAGAAGALSRGAWGVARDRYAIERHATLAVRVIDRCTAAGPVAWPEGRSVWFGGVGGSIPADAEERVRRMMAGLAGRRVVVHGTGLHTRTLLVRFLEGEAEVVGFCDDDRQRHGERMAGLPIVGPGSAAGLGATDVVISSWLHESAVWAGREVYERQGLRVHRLYGSQEASG